MAAASLADGLPVAVSLALAAGAAVVAVAWRLLCAAGGGALARTVSGAAGQTAVLQRGAGLSSLQRPFLQEHGFKHGQVVVAAALLRPQEHAVRLVARFLGERESFDQDSAVHCIVGRQHTAHFGSNRSSGSSYLSSLWVENHASPLYFPGNGKNTVFF